MKNLLLTALTIIAAYCSNGQIGIRTATPSSKLHILGSIATNYRGFTLSTTATATDNLLVFTGSTAESVTLPTAVGITGRSYMIKHAGSNLPACILTIVPAASENIEGIASWVLNAPDLSVTVVSDGVNWQIILQNVPPVAGLFWNQNGNTVVSETTIGTLSNTDFALITTNLNVNAEKMRLTNTGNVGIGTSVFSSNPEKLLVDQGTTNSYNVISARGSFDNYLQLNIKNGLAGDTASTDVIASNNLGTEYVNYIDMGINSSAYSNVTNPILDGPNTAYLYSTGNEFIVGNGTANKNLSIFSGGPDTANIAIRIDGTGLVGIGAAFVVPLTERLQVDSSVRFMGLNRSIFFDAISDPYAGIKNISRPGEVNELMLFSGYRIAGTGGPDRIRLATHEIYFSTSPTSSVINSGDPGSFYRDTVAVPTRMYINQNGDAAIGTTAIDPVRPAQLLVDAGPTTSYNLISAKGNFNTYLQLNIQNASNEDTASSELVAIADNGDTTVNYIKLGINGTGFIGTNVISGASNSHLFATGNDFVIGNSTDDKHLNFFTSTAGTGTQKMRISNAGLLPVPATNISLGNATNRFTEIWATAGTIQTSDSRMKKNILPLTYGLNEVMLLNPVAYNWLDERYSANKIGLIAQEVRKIIPQVVTGNEETESLGMNYAEMVPVLINAIKELKTKIETLKVKAKEL